MSLLHVLKPSFAGGEADPALSVRSDLAKYNTFLTRCRNFSVHPQGGVSNRPGTLFLAATKNPAKRSRLIPFEFNTDNCYAMEFGEGYIRFFTRDGVILGEDGRPYEVPTPYTQDDLPNIAFAQSADVVYLACKGYRPKMLTRYGHNRWTLEDYPFKNGPYLPYDGEAKGHIIQTQETKAINYTIKAKKNGSYYYLTSPDLQIFDNNPVFKEDIRFANGVYFKGDAEGTLYTSSDKSTWVRRVKLPMIGYSSLYQGFDIIFFNNTYVLRCPCGVFISTDLNNWSNIFPYEIGGKSGNNPEKMYVLDKKIFIVYSIGILQHAVIYTPDLSAWLTPGIPKGIRIEALTYGDGIYLYSYTPGNGTTTTFYASDLNGPWTEITSVSSLGSQLSFSNGRFYAVTSYNNRLTDPYSKIYFSTAENIQNWTLFYNPGNGKTGTFCLCNGSLFFTAPVGYLSRVEADNSVTEIAMPSGYEVWDITYTPLAGQESALKLVSTAYTFDKDVFARKFKVSKTFKASQIAKTFTATKQSEVIVSGGGWIFQTSGTWSGEINIETSKDKINWSVYRSYSSAEGKSNYNITGNFDGDVVFVRIVSDLTGNADASKAYVSFSSYSFTSYIYLYGIGYLEPQVIKVGFDQDTEYIKDYIDEKEGDLYVGAWSEASGWPSSVCIYQGRVCWGKDFTIDATKVEEYTNFGVSIPLTDSDAVSTNVRAGGLNAIEHLVAGNRLLAFTSGGEFASVADTFTPSSCGMIKQTNRGASRPDPVIIGQRIIYAQSMGTVLRDFAYNFESDGYDGDDLCVLSRHLFTGRQITDMAYQQEPDSLLWVVLSDGSLLCCTYMREQDVLAWSKMETDGLVESVCCIPGNSQNDIYLTVKRGEKRFVERLAPRPVNKDRREQVFLDAAVVYEGEPVTQLGGLEHLEGRTAAVLADGAVHADCTVKDGKITLSAPCRAAVAGLPYTAELVTMPVDFQLPDGTMRDRKSRPCSVFVSVTNSAGAKAGQTGGALEEIIFRSVSDPLSAAVPLKSGTYEVCAGTFSDYNPTVTVRQEYPLPLTVTGLAVRQRI